MNETFDLRPAGDGFSRYFEIVPATDENEKEAAFRIRHSVYCVDLGWELPRIDGMETDNYDAQSLHCLVRALGSGNDIGCVRIVRTSSDDPHALLPFERSCAESLHREVLDPGKLARDRIGEVSRLAIVGQYRRRRGEERTPGTLQDSDFGGGDGRSRFPWPLVGLYMGVFAMAERHGLDTLFLLSEPRLLRHLNKIGIINRQIGEAIEHRGLRAPAVMDVREVIDNLDPLLRSVYQVACEALDGCQNHA